MKRILIGMAAVLMTAGIGFAAEPAMTGDSAKGKIYTDAKGMSLYTFDKDKDGKTACYEACAKKWPPMMAAADAAAEGDWTLVDRDDGGKMWAYEGKPLYLFIDDKAPGDITGDNVGGVWHLAKAE